MNDADNNIANFSDGYATTDSFKIKKKITGQTDNKQKYKNTKLHRHWAQGARITIKAETNLSIAILNRNNNNNNDINYNTSHNNNNNNNNKETLMII